MKKTAFYTTIILFLFTVSCKKEEEKKDCSDYSIDFVYSLGYAIDSSYVTVCYSDASKDIPETSTFEWSVNGDDAYDSYAKCPAITNNGHFSIVLTVITPDGIRCSVSKEFDITGLD